MQECHISNMGVSNVSKNSFFLRQKLSTKNPSPYVHGVYLPSTNDELKQISSLHIFWTQITELINERGMKARQEFPLFLP